MTAVASTDPTRDEELNAIREGVRAVVTRFDDGYWLDRD
jgi:acyl-CoA dehydrogenase